MAKWNYTKIENDGTTESYQKGKRWQDETIPKRKTMAWLSCTKRENDSKIKKEDQWQEEIVPKRKNNSKTKPYQKRKALAGPSYTRKENDSRIKSYKKRKR